MSQYIACNHFNGYVMFTHVYISLLGSFHSHEWNTCEKRCIMYLGRTFLLSTINKLKTINT